MADEHEEVPTVDDEERQRTFEAFIHFWVYVFAAAILILVFLAIFNT
jgi:hypothetical protein